MLVTAGALHPARSADPPNRFIATESAGDSVQRVVITVNKSRTLRFERPFGTATVGSADIADALPLSDRVLYIQAKKIGTTNISIFDPGARLIGIIDLEIAPDTANLQQKIRAGSGSGGIRVSSSGGQIVLSGMAADAVAADRAVSVAKSLGGDVVNAMQVAPTQQVLLEVRFLEATRAAGRELGVNLFAAGRSGTRGINTGSGGPSPSNSPPNSSNSQLPIISGAGTLPGGVSPFVTVLANLLTNNGMTIDALVTALETKGLVRRLAEPNLMALSGDTARFLAGGEFPVPVPSSTSGGLVPTIAIEYKRFGVELSFTPTVLSRGAINLRIFPSVSDLDFANPVRISGTEVPTLIKREAVTTVELRDGQSFAIAGLLSAQNTRDLSQVPWLGSVPVLGALFRSSGYQQRETDLVIIVTPRLISPTVPGDRLATPLDSRLPSNDVDFFLNGQPEVKKRFSDFVSAGGEGQGPYGHLFQPEAGPAPVRKR
jgi:pilus assembly protein CpaC